MALGNIKQVTHFDLINNIVENGYFVLFEDLNIVKLGYICSDEDLEKPIFIKTGDNYRKIKVGKNGIYSVQLENELTTDDNEVFITGLRVPRDAQFIIDYVVKS